MAAMHYFAGANTAKGFFSCFEDIVPKNRRRKMVYIKGGPGVGKSTLMKKLGAAGEEAGLYTEYFHCSSDPGSLDGVAFPEKGMAIMDGTAPHVYDPVTPGARDRLLSLGDYLDEGQLSGTLAEIEELQKRISAKFQRAYCYLGAAEKILQAAPAGEEDEEKARDMAANWAKLLPSRGGIGQRRSFPAAAFTPEGLRAVTEFPPETEKHLVKAPFGAYADGLMRRMDAIMGDRGLDRIALLDPLTPEKLQMLYLPKFHLLFGWQREEEKGDRLNGETLFTMRETGEESFDQNAYGLLCQRAKEQLTAAKALHDQLEKPYVRAMDFAAHQAKTEEIFMFFDLPYKAEGSFHS